MRIAIMLAGLILSSCATGLPQPKKSEPHASLTFMPDLKPHESREAGGPTFQMFKANSGKYCTDAKLIASFSDFIRAKKTIRVAPGRFNIYANTNYATEFGTQPSAQDWVSCSADASFIAIAGKTYKARVSERPNGECALVVVEAGTENAPADLDVTYGRVCNPSSSSVALIKR